LVAVLLGGGLWVGATPAQAKPVPGATCPTGGAQVVLDPGHGGADTGAINATYGLQEKTLTLEIASRAAGILQAHGYTVALTRTSDVALGNSERGAIANACGAAVFVEIHLNGSSDPAVDYTQTFWGKRRKDLAFSQTMSGALDALGIPNKGVGQFANGGLLTATMPSTLAETVFVTSDYEGQLLADPSSGRLDQIAAAIAAGVANWLG
jgi:N-acetylmuramoyl-L-alanine amidase